MFEIGKITEDQLHALSARMFANQPGRRYWSIAGAHQISHYVTERDRKFAAILDQEHTKVSAAAAMQQNPQRLEPTEVGGRSSLAAFALGTVAGAFLSGVVAAARHRNGRTR